MHDSLPPGRRAEILATNPDTYLHVTRTPSEALTDLDAAAGEHLWGIQALDRLIGLGAYEIADAPVMYVYRLEVDDRAHTGVVAAVEVEAFVDGRVLGHEAVQPERVEALVEHFEAVPVRSDLVALIHDMGQGLDEVLAATMSGAPVLSTTSVDGVEQTVWRIDDPAMQDRVAGALSAGTGYVADGHHRVAASRQQWESAGGGPGHAVLSVFYSPSGLRPLAFHRRVVGPVDAPGFLEALGPEFVVDLAAGPQRRPGGFDLYAGGRWHTVRPRDAERPPGAAGLDVSLLHRQILRPLLGISEVSDPALELISELTPLAELVARCDGDLGALFLLVPPTVGKLIEVAERHEVMIPKTTYFDPKPLSGVFLQFPDHAT
jgi:uncharacterized protein (DUF1015 family)